MWGSGENVSLNSMAVCTFVQVLPGKDNQSQGWKLMDVSRYMNVFLVWY